MNEGSILRMNGLLQDLHYASRQLWRRPALTLVACVTLALAIGANAGVFSVVNALLLRSLPFREPDRLAVLNHFFPPHDSAIAFHDWSQHSGYLADAALFEEADANLGGSYTATRIHLSQTSWNFFSLLGTKLALGRAFAPDEDVDGAGWGPPGRNAVAVIGYGIWQQLFGGDPKVLGTTVRIDGIPLTVVGVAPPEFDYPDHSVLWKPGAFSPGNNGWTTIARLKPDISWNEARAAFAVETEQQSPNAGFDISNPRPTITSLRDALAGSSKNASLAFMGAAGLVLLVAFINLASLSFSRATERASELAIRSALGASHARVIRHLVAEYALICSISAVGGVATAFWIARLATKLVPPPIGIESYSILDLHVLAFVSILSVFVAAALGIVPSLYVQRFSLFDGRTLSRSTRAHPGRQVLVGAQVMLAVVLLSASVGLGRAFTHLMTIDRGYDVKALVTVSVSLEGTTHQINKSQLPYFDEVLGRISRIRGVRSASSTEFLPLYASAFVGGPFGLDGRPASRSSNLIPVFSGYFHTMGARILYGREFTEAEVGSGAKVAVVNDRFASGFGRPQDVIGRQLTSEGDSPWRIVGVVSGMEYETDPTTAGGNQVFVPSSNPGGFFSTFVARVDGRAEDYLPAIRDAIQSADRQVPVFGAKTMEQRLHDTFVGQEFYRTAVSSLGGFALLLALIGVYGTVFQAIVERTREMGIRIALGRTRLQLRAMLLSSALLVVLTGATAGVAGAQLIGHVLESLIDGARPIGLAASVSLIVLSIAIAAATVWSATRRIATLDVISIMRNE